MSSQEAKGQQVLNTEESLIMDLKAKVAFLEAKVKELETTIETMIEAQEQEREDRELLGGMYSYENYQEYEDKEKAIQRGNGEYRN